MLPCFLSTSSLSSRFLLTKCHPWKAKNVSQPNLVTLRVNKTEPISPNGSFYACGGRVAYEGCFSVSIYLEERKKASRLRNQGQARAKPHRVWEGCLLAQEARVCIREKEIAVLVDTYSARLRRLELPHWAILVSFISPITHQLFLYRARVRGRGDPHKKSTPYSL